MAKKTPPQTVDAGTAIGKVRDLLESLGWQPTGSTVDGDSIVVSARPAPQIEASED